jgi:hypothetical protein
MFWLSRKKKSLTKLDYKIIQILRGQQRDIDEVEKVTPKENKCSGKQETESYR